MKYLRRINEAAMRADEAYRPYINWNLINDIRELALESLDNGAEIRITVYIDHNDIVDLEYSHAGNKETWDKYKLYDTSEGFEGDISYDIVLDEDGDSRLPYLDVQMWDIIEQIQKMYPDENIT